MSHRILTLPQDLDLLTKMIIDCFQYPENPAWGIEEDEQQNLVDEIENFKRFWWLIRILQVLYPALRDVIRGYIWEEEGQPAGLVLYSPVSIMGGDAWDIGTVGVLPAFRRKGIARKLVEVALEDIRSRKAKTVRLSVFSKNMPAYSLYVDVGFNHYASAIELVRDAEIPSPELLEIPPLYRIIEMPESEWKPRYELALRTVPTEVQQFRPIDPRDYRPPTLIRGVFDLAERLSGVKKVRYGVFREYGGESPYIKIAAVGAYRARTKPGGTTGISISFDKEYSKVVPYLMHRLVSELVSTSPGRRISFGQMSYNESGIEAAQEIGFTLRNEWHELGMVLDPKALKTEK